MKVAGARRGRKRRDVATPPHDEIHLRISALLRNPAMGDTKAALLIDTGAEVCLVRRGLLPSEIFFEAQRPMKLVAANNQRLLGGSREAVVSICMRGVFGDSNQEIETEIPTRLYEAGIAEDVLLSYAWLVTRKLDVLSARHGLCGSLKSREYFIPGICASMISEVARLCRESPVKINLVPTANDVRALDL